MKQKVTLHLKFLDFSNSLTIEAIYQTNNMLIAVSRISSNGNSREVVSTRSSSKIVSIEGTHVLPVKHFVINPLHRPQLNANHYNQVESIEDIEEISGLTPLVFIEENELGPAGTAALNENWLLRPKKIQQNSDGFDDESSDELSDKCNWP